MLCVRVSERVGGLYPYLVTKSGLVSSQPKHVIDKETNHGFKLHFCIHCWCCVFAVAKCMYYVCDCMCVCVCVLQ